MIIADLHDVDGVGQVSMQSPSFSVSESAACIAASDLPDDPTNTKRPRILLHLTRKRTQNKEYWTCNVRKKSRQAGLEYISKGGAVTPARFGTIKSLKNCHDKCKFKCAMKISESTRLQIHVDFWQHSDDGKAHYYVQTVTRAPRKYGESSRRKFSYKYSMFDGSQLVRVCKVFYLTTLNVSQRRIGYALSVKVNPCSGIIRDDRRGRHHRHRVISVARKNEVRIHIKSLPTMESHYRRASSKKEYLETGLTIAKLYEKYVEKCSEQLLIAESDLEKERFTAVKEHVYRDIFNHEFNLEFHKPQQDRCDICELHRFNENDEKYQSHVTSKTATKTERDRDRQRTNSAAPVVSADGLEAVICFDLENVLSCPRANVSNFLYKRKLSVYRLTAHCSIDRKGYGSIWCETTSGRSGNDLASPLVIILEMIKQQHPTITKLVLWSDSCVAQNKNSVMSFALQNFMQKHSTIQSIEQKFCEPGHSSIQEVDNIHSHIEKVLNVSEIYSPLSLMRALLKVTPKRPLNLRQLKTDDFKDYQSAAKKLRYSGLPYTKVKHIV
jgi:hypothetical protein